MATYGTDDDVRAPRSRGPWAIIALVLIVLAAIAAALWLWLASDDESAGPDVGVSVDDVAEDRFSDFLIGEEVTLSGEIVAFLDERAFWIGGDGFLGDSVLIVTEAPVVGLEEETVVEAHGVVADFESTGISDELDSDETTVGADFGPYEEQNVLLATHVEVIEPEAES